MLIIIFKYKFSKLYKDMFLLDGFDDEDKKDKYIPDEELDEEYDQGNIINLNDFNNIIICN